MRTKIILCLLGLVFITGTRLQAQNVDTAALYIMQRMSNTLKNLSSCSVHVQAFYDTPSDDLGLIKRSKDEMVYATFPNQLRVDVKDENERHALIYDGKQLIYYSYDDNDYSSIDNVPSTTLETIQLVSKTYGIEVPAADFFYPSFVDDIKSTAITLSFLGRSKIDGKECLHIAGKDSTMSYQFWIQNDPLFLPVKLVIVYNNRPGVPQYEAVYSDWNLNVNLPKSLFDFTAPPQSQKIDIKPTANQ
jgi:hypothetical protein